ncbi:MAG TPA: caspase family protein [Nitrospiraceae bacterium]|nr:caspase family protein [Nitrospiraceae bacterium]
MTLLLGAASVAYGQIGRPEGLYYKSWGVVIGIDDYLVAPKLSGSIADAKAMAEALRQLGFDEVVELYDKDASFRRLNHILNEYLPRRVGRQDRLVLFFSGHAGTTQDMNGKELGYLVPWDAQVTNASKAVTLDQLKEFSRRVMSKHTLFLLNAGVSGWEVTPPQQLSLEGRLSPEEETDKRAVQVLTAAGKGESLARKDGRGVFVQIVLSGLKGAADRDKNGWVMASELGAYVKQQMTEAAGSTQHPQFARLDGDGDTILIEGKKAFFKVRPELKTDAERVAAAKEEYEEAFLLLQQQKSVQDALDHLNKAIQYNPSYGDAYVLKSFLYLDRLSNIEEALAAAQLATKYAATNPDSYYTLGLVQQRKGQFAEAEKALQQALAVNPNYSDVYLSLGDLYAEDIKDKNKAVEAYRRYLETGGTENKAKEYIDQAEASKPASKQ